MRVAVVGCVHGQLNAVYAAIARLHKRPDLLVVCGDIQACRNRSDLRSMAVPPKYRQMGDFHQYFTGAKKAPVLTVVVGGNHEASAFFSQIGRNPDAVGELNANSGWIAHNIYFLGHAGVVSVKGLIVAGLSGVYYQPHTNLPRLEAAEFKKSLEKASESEARFSAYHVRSLDVKAMEQIPRGVVDLMVTHDWPAGVAQAGDLSSLLKAKPFFKKDIETNKLGNPLTTDLLYSMRPQWWLSAHLHVRYRAQIGETRFLALDKVGRNRKFLEVIEVKPQQASSKDAQVKNWLEKLAPVELTAQRGPRSRG